MPGELLWINYDPVSGTPQYDANELRQAMALPLMYGGRAVGARQGVRPGGPPIVSLAGSIITVQPHLSLIDPALTTTQGPYWVAIPVAENPVGGPLAAADATNPRRDVVVGRVYDHDQDASGLRLARSEYRAGAAGPTPSLPAVQAGEILLATIDVPRSGNGAAVVTNVYAYTVAAGGILPVRNKAERDAVSAFDSLVVARLDLGRLEMSFGGAWRIFSKPTSAINFASETTTSGVYVDLATAGPAVTVETGTEAEVYIAAEISNSTPASSRMAYAISGASTRAPSNDECLMVSGTSITKLGAMYHVTGLTPGNNTFTAKYRVSGGTGTFANRHISVRPI